MSVAEIRRADQLDAIDALIIPGGESTSMAKLMDAYEMRAPLQAFAGSGRPLWGTCAGLILLASRLAEDRPEPLGLMDVVVQRNGFGRQVDSFETELDIDGVSGGSVHAVFIRALRSSWRQVRECRRWHRWRTARLSSCGRDISWLPPSTRS